MRSGMLARFSRMPRPVALGLQHQARPIMGEGAERKATTQAVRQSTVPSPSAVEEELMKTSDLECSEAPHMISFRHREALT